MMAARTTSRALSAACGLTLAAATLLLAGCGSTGVGVAASNRGAAVGVSVGTPNADSAQRGDKWPALPPPQLMTPEQIKAARQEPAASSGSPSTPTSAPASTSPATPKP